MDKYFLPYLPYFSIIVSLLVLIIIQPSTNALMETSVQDIKLNGKGEIDLEIQVEYDLNSLEDPISPGFGKREVPITVSYRFPVRTLMEKIKLFMMNIELLTTIITMNLIIENVNQWTSVNLSSSTLSISTFSDEWQQHNSSLFISISDNAPAFQNFKMTLKINEIEIIGFLGNIFSISPYNVTNELHYTAGYIPLLSVTNPVSKEGKPDSQILHNVTLTNTGNARSIIQFSVKTSDIPNGWSVQDPASIYLNPDKTIDLPITVITPRESGYIDEWAQIPIRINIRSVVDPSGDSANYTVTLVSHCISDLDSNDIDNGTSYWVVIFLVFVISIIILIRRYNKVRK